MKKCLVITLILLFGCTVVFLGCGREQLQSASDVLSATSDVLSVVATTYAMAQIGSASGSTLTGTAIFTKDGENITISVEIQDASPGLHAVHIHENGDCSAPDATSAGGHWNPTDVAHGKWGEGEFHLGDLGNITVGEDGTGSFELTTDLWEIGTGSDIDVIGKGIIVHADADDFTSQPSGNAGARIGCGVIEPVELEE